MRLRVLVSATFTVFALQNTAFANCYNFQDGQTYALGTIYCFSDGRLQQCNGYGTWDWIGQCHHMERIDPYPISYSSNLQRSDIEEVAVRNSQGGLSTRTNLE